MNYETLLYEVDEHILTLTLNRPEKLNAFDGRMLTELIAAFDAADADDAVRAIIVTGAGRAFCAGADLSAGAATFDFAAVPIGPTSWAHHATPKAASNCRARRRETAAGG